MFGLPTLAKFASLLTNVKKSSQPFEILDKTPPAPPILEVPEFTKEARVSLNGTSEPGSKVTIFAGDKDSEVIANSEGKFSFDLNLLEGENILWAKASDQVGNASSESKKYKIVFDNKAPQIEILEPVDGASFSGGKSNAAIKGTTNEDSDVFINEKLATADSKGNFYISISLAEGENLIILKAQDPAGNESEKSLTLYYYP